MTVGLKETKKQHNTSYVPWLFTSFQLYEREPLRFLKICMMANLQCTVFLELLIVITSVMDNCMGQDEVPCV